MHSFKIPMILLAALLAAVPAVAGQLHPALEAQLAAKTDGAPVKALVVLRDQADVATLDWQLHSQKATLAERHVTVIEALKNVAKATQPALVADLEARQGRGEVLGFTPHWLINAVVVTATPSAIREIAARDDVDVVEPNLEPELIEPVEAYDAGDLTTEIGITPGLVSINARRVWDELGIRGEGTLVGNIDTGVQGSHPALADRWRGNFAPWQECWLDVLDNGTEFPADFGGHGTHVMGTMCGLAPDDTIGVSPESQWIATNAIDQGVNPDFDNDILLSLAFMTDPDGDPTTLDDVPDVVQNSWGVMEAFGYPDCDSRWWDAIDACEAAGVVITWSAGNEGPSASSLRSPADRASSIYNVFSVASTQPTYPFTISGFSSRGPSTCPDMPPGAEIKPEISAPGDGIYSSVPGGYGYKSGTSMAGPHVAGVVALMRSANPNIDVITIKQVIMDTALDLGNPGDDNTYGNGFIDAYAAVLAVMEGIGYLEGTVVGSDDLMPLADVQVRVVDGYQAAVTDAQGQFDLTLQQGLHQVEFSKFGYGTQVFTIEITEDQTLDETFVLGVVPTASLSGTVYDADGNVAADATVSVLDTPLTPVQTDAAGHYAFDLPVGHIYGLEAVKAGVGRIVSAVEVIDDTVHDLHLLPAGALAEVSLDAIDLRLLPGTTATKHLLIRNLGADDLNYRLSVEETGKARIQPEQRPTVTATKGEKDPTPGRAPDKDAGGPDGFGYIWIDSDEPGGPTYDWVDISGTGEVVGGGDDANHGPFNLGFDFPFYDQVYDVVRVCTNGWLSFIDTDTEYTNQGIPNSSSPNALLCPFWDDLNPSTGGTIYYLADAANQRFIVQWEGVPHYYADGAEYFQVILYADGTIVYQYETVYDGTSATVGIENPTGTDGLEIVYNAPYLHDGLAILVSNGPQVPWIDYDPLAGTIDPASTVQVDVMFDTTDLDLGVYTLNLMVNSNDIGQPTITIPVTLTVDSNPVAVDEVPQVTGLLGAVPNPFNPTTNIRFNLVRPGPVTLRLYDVQGRLVRTLLQESRPQGVQEVRWDGADDSGRPAASGSYYARLVAGDATSVTKLTLVR